MSVAGLWNRMRRVAGMGHGTIVDDNGPIQTVQLIIDGLETADNVPVAGIYGFASNAPAGTNYITVAIAGDPSKLVAIASNHQTQRHKGLNPGEVAIGLPGGARILFTATGATITAGAFPMKLIGDLHVTGAVIAGFGGADQVGLQTHLGHSGSNPPTPGT